MRSRAPGFVSSLLAISTLLPLTACDRVKLALVERLDLRPNQEQTPERVEEIARLEVQRTGRLRMVAVSYGRETQGERPVVIEYSLRRPYSRVDDTDIRGYLDGSVKYGYNQGTAYHLRVGRRYGGLSDGQYELKRSLLRWQLPSLPSSARLVSAEVTLWIESFLWGSPLEAASQTPELHLYAYPLTDEWNEGAGGIRKNDLSRAAPGEASWTEARAGELAWAAPGALRSGVEPVGLGVITQDDTTLTIGGGRLVEYLRENGADGTALNLLLKLGDEEEASWGTELGIMSSEFGDDKDIVSRRPRLDLAVEFRSPSVTREESFVLEPGGEHISAVFRHPDTPVLLTASVADGPGAPPAIHVRGGTADVATDSARWQRLWNPLSVEWTWSQFKVSVPAYRITWGDSISVELLETYVSPGPREEQVPEMVLIAPSGRVHRVDGRPVDDSRYVLGLGAMELGLWRYGWSFRPTPTRPLGSHEGEGVVHVSPSYGEEGPEKLRAFAAHLLEGIEDSGPTDPAVQQGVNGFVRWASSLARSGGIDAAVSDSLISKVREAVESAL